MAAAEHHRVQVKPTQTNWHILSCVECDWFEGFLNLADAEAAKGRHEATGEDVRGELRELLASSG